MNDEQLLRYNRQLMMPDFDYAGQQRLLESKVLVVGLGGLGSPVAMYLAAAGVGELWLADYDEVDLSNLQRQIAHGMADIGRLKVASARDSIARINPDTKVECIQDKLSAQLLSDAVARVDLVLDCTDNFATRFAINEACVAARKPLVSGAAIRSEGQVALFDVQRDDSPCYACVYGDALDDSQLSCSESGVLAPVVGVIGTLQALEAMKHLAGFGEASHGQLLIFDAKVLEWRKLKVGRNPDCATCAELRGD